MQHYIISNHNTLHLFEFFFFSALLTINFFFVLASCF